MRFLQVFNKEFGQVRVVMFGGEPWFVARDVCEILGYSKPWEAIKKLKENEKESLGIRDTNGREHKSTVIRESGLRSLVSSSDMPKAKEFEKWITSEILPSAR